MVRNSFYRFLAALAVFLVIGCAVVRAEPTIDDDRLNEASSDPSNWLMFGQNYTNQRFADLDTVNTSNIERLKLRWTFRSGAKGPFQAQPLVADGSMYVTLPGNHVVALDAATGEVRWRYEHLKRREKIKGSPANRGAALGYGKVYQATNDGRLIALDQKTGALLWSVVMARPEAGSLKGLSDRERAIVEKNIDGLPAKMPPLVYNGMVIVGVTSAGYGIYYNLGVKTLDGAAPPPETFLGLRGFIGAYDAATGEELWRWHSVRDKSWEGDFVETTGMGESLGRDVAHERDLASKLEGNWRAGGSSTWSTPSLDRERGLLFVGTGNASPNDVSLARPGDNLYASSLVALDVRTGEVRWHYQQVPHDLWGYDVASASILFNAEIDGESVPAVGIAGKTGWFYVHHRDTGKLLFRSQPLVPQNNLFKPPTPQGVLISPGSFGGVSWSPGSYDESRGAVYLAAIHRPTLLKLLFAEEAHGTVPYIATDIAEHEPSWGTLSAVDTRNGGKLKWQVRTDGPLIGGVLATGGGLVFVGEGHGAFSAFNSDTGERVWQHDVSAGVNAPPVSYRVGNEQFIAVAAGGSRFFGYPPGDILMSFALEAQ